VVKRKNLSPIKDPLRKIIKFFIKFAKKDLLFGA
jgi:hypothetical protein